MNICATNGKATERVVNHVYVVLEKYIFALCAWRAQGRPAPFGTFNEERERDVRFDGLCSTMARTRHELRFDRGMIDLLMGRKS